MRCPECNSEKVVKAGKEWRKRERVQRYRCKECGRLFVEGGKDTESQGGQS